MFRDCDQKAPNLPKGVTWDDVELIPDPKQKIPKDYETETLFVARNKKTGEIYR